MSKALELIAEAKRSNAKKLDLGNCGLTELPDALFELTALEGLSLDSDWYEYSFEEKGWIKFETRNKGESNNLKKLSQKFNLLRGLKKLFLNSQKELSDLMPLKDLGNLQQLDISNTQVSNLIPLKSLGNLKMLDVRSTKVSDLIPLKDLSNLQVLYIADTQVSDLLPLKDLSNLQDLVVIC